LLEQAAGLQPAINAFLRVTGQAPIDFATDDFGISDTVSGLEEQLQLAHSAVIEARQNIAGTDGTGDPIEIIPTDALEAQLASATEDALAIGESFNEGVSEGLANGQDAVNSDLATSADAAYQAYADAVGFSSPAQRFVEVGTGMAEGVAVGWMAGQAQITTALSTVDGLIKQISGSFQTLVTTAPLYSALFVTHMLTMQAQASAPLRLLASDFKLLNSQLAQLIQNADLAVSRIKALIKAKDILGGGDGSDIPRLAGGGMIPTGTAAIVGDSPTGRRTGYEETVTASRDLYVLNNRTTRAMQHGIQLGMQGVRFPRFANGGGLNFTPAPSAAPVSMSSSRVYNVQVTVGTIGAGATVADANQISDALVEQTSARLRELDRENTLSDRLSRYGDT
jgi:hypothetical protein